MKQLYHLLFGILLLCSLVCPHSTQAQDSLRIDSLLNRLKKAKQGNYTLILNQLEEIQQKVNRQKALVIGAKAVAVANKLPFLDALPHAYRNIALVHLKYNHFSDASDLASKALQFSDKNQLTYQVAEAIALLAKVYALQQNIRIAIEYYFSAAELFTQIESYEKAGKSYENVGDLYFKENDFDNAAFYYQDGLQTLESHNSQDTTLIHLYLKSGITYRKLKKYRLAQKRLNTGLKISKRKKRNYQTALIAGEIGKIYLEQKNLVLASRYLIENLKLSINTKNWANVAEVLNYIGQTQTFLGHYKVAQQHYDSAMLIAKKYQYLDILENTYEGLSQLHVKTQNFRNAYKYHVKFMQIKDSLVRRRDALKLTQAHASNNLEKKQSEIKRLVKNNQKHEATIKRQNLINVLIILILLLVTGLTVVYYRMNKQHIKDNEILTQRQEEIQMQRDALQAKGNELETAFDLLKKSNKRMTDSINYARYIQTSIFPSVTEIQKHLPESFILFQPRDVVSGDFYWSTTRNGRTILAAIDCTGHGVPGAFLSMIGNNLLHGIVILRGISEADKILNELHLGVRQMLQQAETENKDGMDMALCVIHHQGNEHTCSHPYVEFAGAKNPLVYIKNNEFSIIKGDKFPVGGKQLEEKRLFTKHIIPLDEPTTFYIFSDGFQDQFGGPNGRKFMRKRFYNLLLKIHEKPAQQQKEILGRTILKWMSPEPKQEYRQIDDILVIGTKIYPNQAVV